MKFGYFCNTTNWTHKPYHQLLDETRERQASIDGIVWQIRNVCSLSLQQTFEACKLAQKDITEVL